jgi:hypothetical protein
MNTDKKKSRRFTRMNADKRQAASLGPRGEGIEGEGAQANAGAAAEEITACRVEQGIGVHKGVNKS